MDISRRGFLYGCAAASAGVVLPIGTAAAEPSRMAAAPMFGAAVTPYPDTGRNYHEELAAHEAACGPMGMLRSFDGGRPADWFHASSARGSRAPAVPGWERRPSWHSLKPDAVQVASGALDGWITEYIESIPVTGVPRYLTMWHEPEGKIPSIFPAATWKRAAHRFGRRVRAAGHPDVRYGPIFMSKFTLGGAANHVPAIMASDPADLFSVCDFIGWDPYNEASRHGDYGSPWDDPAYYFDAVVEWTGAHSDLPIAIGETGFVPDPADLRRRATWLTAAASYAREHGFLAMCYFDASVSTPWWLRCVRDPAVTDQPSITAWAR